MTKIKLIKPETKREFFERFRREIGLRAKMDDRKEDTENFLILMLMENKNNCEFTQVGLINANKELIEESSRMIANIIKEISVKN
ncbi:MAG: hypothetical protein AABY22_23170 [Nanoarchaeota archaeon]